MRYLSTSGTDNNTVDLAQALRDGLAADGGLYVPAQLPTVTAEMLGGCDSLPESAALVLREFFAGSILEPALPTICHEALDLPLPVIEFDPGQSWLMELFHGPTAAFKDFAARFLASCLGALRTPGEAIQTVLVATSGDTGGAVAAAFHRRAGFRVVILYPEGRVSARQAHQLGAFGDNVHCFRVQGDFDDCQRLVKQALRDRALHEHLALTSANSISIGRLLPQISYYAHVSCELYRQSAKPVNVIVPTGNLGNALACILARDIGMPIREVILATNANRTLSDFFSGQDYQGRDGLATLANAMDVGDPSNFERLAWFYRDRNLRDAGVRATSIDDQAIEACIKRVHRDTGRVICPHTACAVQALADRRQAGDRHPYLIAATAHPAKFNETVEPLIDEPVTPPPALSELLQRESRAEIMPVQFEHLRDRLLQIQKADS